MIMMMGFLVSLTMYWPPTDSFILAHCSPDPESGELLPLFCAGRHL
jgi:hypothetical protein